jgi:hypothetical protein
MNFSKIRYLGRSISADSADLSGMNFSKIRYLGRSISADSAEIDKNGIVTDDGEVIPISLDHKDEIEAYIDSLKASEKKAQEEKKEELKAKGRVIESLYKTIELQEKDLFRYGKPAKPGELSEAEKDQLKGFKELKGQFDIFATGMDLDVNLYLYNASDKVKAEYFSNLMYAKQVIEKLWDHSGAEIGFPAIPGINQDDWEPPEWNSSETLDDE